MLPSTNNHVALSGIKWLASTSNKQKRSLVISPSGSALAGLHRRSRESESPPENPRQNPTKLHKPSQDSFQHRHGAPCARRERPMRKRKRLPPVSSASPSHRRGQRQVHSMVTRAPARTRKKGLWKSFLRIPAGGIGRGCLTIFCGCLGWAAACPPRPRWRVLLLPV